MAPSVAVVDSYAGLLSSIGDRAASIYVVPWAHLRFVVAISVSYEVTIRSSGAGATLDGLHNTHIFDVVRGGSLRLEELAITQGVSRIQNHPANSNIFLPPHAELLVVTLQVSNEGGCVRIMDGGQLSASHVSFIGCAAIIADGSYGNACGGAVFVGFRSRAHFNEVKFRSCHVSNAQPGALAAGGAMCVDGYASVDNTHFDGCTAGGARASDGFGGALFVTSRGLALLSNGTSFVGNQVLGTPDGASHGGAVLSEGTTVYLLPAPAGHFVFGQRCYVQRAVCTRDGKGFYDDQACVDTALTCSLQVEANATVCQSSDRRDSIDANITANITANIYAADEAGGGEDHYHCTFCQPILDNQQCPWRELPELVGGFVHNLPQSVDGTFPQACAPGVLGSREPEHQVAASCGGRCAAGWLCPDEATLEPIECPAGSACPAGSSVALPCEEGHWSSDKRLESTRDCTQCTLGHQCTAGTVEPSSCTPGTHAPGLGLVACVAWYVIGTKPMKRDNLHP